MKIKNKFLAGALVTVAALGIVGSISGTFAWYSYNTKDNISYHGIASGNSQNLQVRLLQEKGDTVNPDIWGPWGTSISQEDIVAASKTNGYAGDTLQPVSFMKQIDNNLTTDNFKDEDFHGRPDQYTNKICASDKTQINVRDEEGKYTFLHVTFQVKSEDKLSTDSPLLEQEVYLSDIRCYSTTTEGAGKDMSHAVRLYLGTSISGSLIAPGIQGAENSIVTDLYGDGTKLSGGEGQKGVVEQEDTLGIEGYTTYTTPLGQTEINKAEPIEYGVHGVTETALTPKAVKTAFNDSGLHDSSNTGISLGKTKTDPAGSPLTIEMYVYLQGWDESCRDNQVGAEFDLGFTIQTDKLGANTLNTALDTHKDTAIYSLKAYRSQEDWGSYAESRLSAISAGETAIRAANSIAAVDAALAAAKQAIDAIATPLTLVKDAAKAELDYLASIAKDVSGISEAVAAGKSAIDLATSKKGVEDALNEAKEAILTLADPLYVAKKNAKAELALEAVAETDAGYTDINDEIAAGIAAIDGAANEGEVASALAAAKEAIFDIKLANAQEAAVAALSVFTSTEVSDEVSSGLTAIGEATTLEEVQQALEAALEAINEILNPQD